jgi:hypothetical protein
MDFMYQESFKILISNPLFNYKRLVKICFDFQLRQDQELFELPTSLNELIEVVRIYWRITKSFQTVCLFEFAAKSYCDQEIDVNFVFRTLQNSLEFISEVDAISNYEVEAVSTSANHLSAYADAQLKNFFHESNVNLKNSPKSSKDLETIFTILGVLHTLKSIKITNRIHDFLKYTNETFVEASNRCYDDLLASCTRTDTISDLYLIELTAKIKTVLFDCVSRFDITLFQVIHLPSLVCRIIYPRLAFLLQDFGMRTNANADQLSIALEVYMQLRELQQVCEDIDYKIAETIPISLWFLNSVYQWLDQTTSKLIEWVGKAILNDNLELEGGSHSSAIIDIFTAFQGAVDFLKKLNWPNHSENTKFHYTLYYEIILAIEKFILLTFNELLNDLKASRDFQTPPPSKSAKIGKFRVPIPKMIRKKTKTQTNNYCRISENVL